ncbi:thioredoxin-like protein [Parachaetomium inaequale]|uniref:Thioredoxin-like protein n=1 Tax=Parachaetomium inaequale TaxID=2588326 RepID=A0AAN6PEX4_9PEZI|nr:thioredoxin-like protein [Parachaetomium inaequale]
MPSQRRVRVITYLVLAGIVTLLFLSQARHSRGSDQSLQDFRSKTVNAMEKNHEAGRSVAGTGGQAGQKAIADHDVDADGDIDEDDTLLAKQMADRLRQAEQKAKDNAKAKGPNKPESPQEVVGVGSSASGQKRPAPKDKAETQPAETEEDHEVEGVLNSILKKSPVIIFSKSYCPFSKMAKGILLDKYTIEPAPFVVELDQHPLGPKIQARLGEMTGRRTVPNVMVYGQSIGGGDDISALDKEKTLADKITSLGQTRISIALRFAQSAQKAG